MDDTSPLPPQQPPRVPPVEPELLGSAMFLFAEYLQRLADEAIIDHGEEDDLEDDEDEGASAVNMRDVLDLFADELGASVPITLNLYMRVTALFRLLAASPSLARLAADNDESANTLSETALLAAARLDLHVNRSEGGGVADFDPRQFREALIAE
ncbi:MAG TPA: hypothetical protein VJ747_02000 [Stellaceae bacterium]|nr:hypothetical protein [Stellaceae bacterium]